MVDIKPLEITSFVFRLGFVDAINSAYRHSKCTDEDRAVQDATANRSKWGIEASWQRHFSRAGAETAAVFSRKSSLSDDVRHGATVQHSSTVLRRRSLCCCISGRCSVASYGFDCASDCRRCVHDGSSAFPHCVREKFVYLYNSTGTTRMETFTCSWLVYFVLLIKSDDQSHCDSSIVNCYVCEMKD